MYKDGEKVQELLWDKDRHVETVVLLSHKKEDTHINVNVEFGKDIKTRNDEKTFLKNPLEGFWKELYSCFCRVFSDIRQ